MFAPKVAKPQTKTAESPTNKLAPQALDPCRRDHLAAVQSSRR